VNATATYLTLACGVSVPGACDNAPLRETVEGLLSLLAEHSLDPRFEEFGNFIMPATRASETYNETTRAVEYIDAGPIYPQAPGAVRFWGNFFALSAVFNVDTDDAATIRVLTEAIRANQRTPAYLAAKAECGDEKQHQAIARGLALAAKRAKAGR
jgi:hypothetical protein